MNSKRKSRQQKTYTPLVIERWLLIYAIEKDAVFGDKVIDAIDSAEDEEFAISPLVKLECLVKPLICLDLSSV